MTALSVAALLREAIRLHHQGNSGKAESLCRTAIKREPDNFHGLHLLAFITMQQGRLEEAASVAARAIKRNPASTDALMLLGSINLMQKRPEEALRLFDRAVETQPQNIDALYNRAVVLGQVARWSQALAGFDQVLSAKPELAEAWFNRGNVLVELGLHEDALDSFDRALMLSPGNADALNNRGNTLAIIGRHGEALESFGRVLALQPHHVDALTNQATSLSALGRRDLALSSCEQALAIKPGHIPALVTRGNILHAMERYAEAVASYQRALALDPADVTAIVNCGISLLELGQFEEALVHAERAVALAPADARPYLARAKALQALARRADAIRDYEKAIELKPDIADARHNLATCLLALGRFKEGWAHYQPRSRPDSGALWDGNPVPGTLLIWCDEGLGDQIIYAGIVPELSRFAGQVIIEVDERLVTLFERSFPDVSVVGPSKAGRLAGQIDAQNVTSSLARYLRPTFESFPAPCGYLVADRLRIEELRERFAGDRRPVIGLSWVSKNPSVGRFKGAQLMDFEALLRLPGYRFVDLQYGDTTAERQRVERELNVRVEHLDDIDNMNDIEGLAALISVCDAVLTVSNTTAHLAGALGAQVIVMVPLGRGHLWYWFPDRPASPWYPRLQVRLQAEGQSWSDLIAGLTPEIRATVDKG